MDSSRGVPSCKNIHSIVYTISGNAPSYRSLDPAECSRLKFAPSHKLHHVVCSITGDAPSPASGWKVLKLRIRFAPCHPGQLTFSGVHVATADQLISLVPTWQQPTADQLISLVPTWPHRIIWFCVVPTAHVATADQLISLVPTWHQLISWFLWSPRGNSWSADWLTMVAKMAPPSSTGSPTHLFVHTY